MNGYVWIHRHEQDPTRYISLWIDHYYSMKTPWEVDLRFRANKQISIGLYVW